MSDLVDPYKLARQNYRLEGNSQIAEMPRIAAMLDQHAGRFSYVLDFDTDLDNRCVIRGQLEAEFTARCQRCLQLFDQQLSDAFVVSPIREDSEAKNLPEEYEPILLLDNKLNVGELIEDEFILAMPIVPMHKSGANDCVEIKSDDEPKSEKQNPFKVLQEFKLDKNS